MSYLRVYEIDKLEMRYVLSHLTNPLLCVFVDNWQCEYKIALEDCYGNIVSCCVADYVNLGNGRYQLFVFGLKIIYSLTCSKGESEVGAKQSGALTAGKRCQVCRHARRIELDENQFRFDEE